MAIIISPRLRRSSYYLLFSLAIADLIVTMVCEPLFLESLLKRTFFNECATSLERPYTILSTLSCSASVFHLAAISFDRLIAVVFPIRHEHLMNKCGVRILLIISWAFPISIPILIFVLPPSFPQGFTAMGTFAFCYFVIILSYTLIVVFLLIYKKKRRQMKAGTVSVNMTARTEVRVAVMLAVVIGVFTACWVPVMTAMFASSKPLMKRNGPLHMWLRTLSLSNSAMNFFIYSAVIRDFRDAYAGIFRKICSLPVAHSVLLIAVNISVGFLGTLGNLLVCAAVATNPRLRRSSNYLLASLAIADLIVTMVCEPIFVAILSKIIFFQDCAAALQTPYIILSTLSSSASVTHMAAISVDRFIAVVFPLRHGNIMRKYGLKIMLVVAWFFPMLFPILGEVLPDSFPKAFLATG
ncbi:unnamed protein product, partial [Porites evermanni]